MLISSRKIISFDDLVNTRHDADTIVHCHGCFDLLHLGHIRYLQEARTFGDILIVTITPDEFINKGSGRPFFTGLLRVEAVAALECVSFVALNKWATAVEAIRLLRPSIYVKGPECRSHKTPGLIEEESAVSSYGGEVKYTSGEVWSSTILLNRLGAI